MMAGLLERTIFEGSQVRALFAVVFASLIFIAFVTDVRERRIPNWLVGMLAISGLFFSITAGALVAGLVNAFGGMVVALAIWLGFYAMGVLGAGDVKFFAAAAAWLGPSGAWRAALLSALAGGVLAVGFLIRDSQLAITLRRFALVPWTRRLDIDTMRTMTPERTRRQLPYGVALGVGVLLAAWSPTLIG